jgi:outer membrane protein assembly factor BamA
MTQADFYKFNDLHNGEIVSAEKLRGGWEYLARQYHNKGYMQAKIEATPNYDRAQSTVSYAVTVTSGPVYTMGTLRVLKVNDDIREMLLKAWKIPSGTVFNEGAIRSLTATNNVNIALENALKSMILSYTLKLHDDVHTVDVDLTLQKKP